VILRLLGFGVVSFVGIDLDETQVGDVAIEIIHNGLYTRTQIWLKLRNGTRGWGSTSMLQSQYHYTSYLCRVSSTIPKRQRSVPRIGDIWVPKLFTSSNHFIRLYILGVEYSF
jgi:hypothetical protein